MPKRDRSSHSNLGLDAAEPSEGATATMQLRQRRRGDDTISSNGARRLRNFIDRLFETGVSRASEARRRDARRAPPLPPWRLAQKAAGEAVGTGFDAGPRLRVAGIGGGVIDWADSRLLASVPRTPTPQIITRLFGMTVMLIVLALGTSSITIFQMRETIRTIGLHAKPAIDAAERVRTALGAMDVDAGSDSLLGDAISTGTSRDFAADVSAQIAAMLQASTDVTAGDPAAAARLATMQYELHLYYGVLGEARDAGRSKPWIAAQRVKFASRLLRSHVMDQADAFEAGNREQLEEAYARSQQQSLTLAGSYLGLGALLAATLIAAQFILLRRTRRLINLPLALATAALVAGMLWVGIALVQERADLSAGKTDALERLVALRKAKAAAYAINADEAMWLIDHEVNRTDFERDFATRAPIILGVDLGDPAALARLQAQYAAAGEPGGAAAPPLGGLLGDAFSRATLAESGVASTAQAIAAFIDFVRVDRQLHELEDKGDHRGALELRTGNKPGQSLHAFARLDKALDAAIAVADTAFDQRIASVTSVAGWLVVVTGMSLILTFLLAGGGFWLRYKEYR
jgi:hypothetical protein